MDTEFLTPTELRQLCGFGRDHQCQKLEELGIPYKRDGSRILVSRVHVRQWLLGEQLRPSVGPRLDLVR